MSFNRQRVALACTYCRHRKRRCDATKPRCNNCTRSGADCHYDDGPSQRIDTSGGTKEIISRLKDIKDMLAEQQQHLSALSSPTPNHSQPAPCVHLSNSTVLNASGGSTISASGNETQPADDESLPFSSNLREPLGVASEPMNIPAEHKTSSSYLLGLPAVKMLVGEYPTNLFFLLESQSPLPPELSPEQSQNPLPPFQIERSVLDHLVATFFSSVHVSHPVLDQAEFIEIYERFLDKGADSSTDSALCMTVFALGAVSSQPIGSCIPQTSPSGTEYMKYALPTLMLRSLWLFSFDLTLAQALVLASVYFAYIVRPLHSWRLIYLATNLLQLKLSSLDCQKQTLNTEVDILRLFWSCFIVECDRLAELELPRSSLQQLTDDANLPRCGNLDDLHMTAYLAEISIRRLLNRIHNSLYPRTPNSLTTSLSSTSLMTPEEFSIDELNSITSVCEELHSQLDLWHAAIPEQFRPPLNFEEIDNDRICILRIRYYAARHIIYRPFVLHVTTHTSSHVSSAIVEKAGTCIESCSLYLYHTSKILRAPSQYTWTFALSSLGAVIILTLSWLNPELRHFVPDVESLQTLAIDNLSQWNISSISDVLAILKEIRRKTRLRTRV